MRLTRNQMMEMAEMIATVQAMTTCLLADTFEASDAVDTLARWPRLKAGVDPHDKKQWIPLALATLERALLLLKADSVHGSN